MRQLSFFNPADYEPRKSADQSKFEINYGDILYAFPEMVDTAFERLNKEIYPQVEPISRDKNMAPIMISGFLKGQIVSRFPVYCGVATNTRFRIQKENFEFIYVKKLDKKKKPSNIETQNSEMILHNVFSDLQDTSEANVFLGYISDHANTYAIEIHAVYLINKQVVWSTDLRDFVAKQNSLANTVQITNNQQMALKDGTVTLKKDAINQ